MKKSINFIFALATLVFTMSGCDNKESSPSTPKTLSMTCVERIDPADHTSSFSSCYEMTYLSDNPGAANGRCQNQADIFAGKTCAQVVSENLATPFGSFQGSCAFVNMVDGLTNPGTNEIIYAYSNSGLGANSTLCSAATGQWTAP